MSPVTLSFSAHSSRPATWSGGDGLPQVRLLNTATRVPSTKKCAASAGTSNSMASVNQPPSAPLGDASAIDTSK